MWTFIFTDVCKIVNVYTIVCIIHSCEQLQKEYERGITPLPYLSVNQQVKQANHTGYPTHAHHLVYTDTSCETLAVQQSATLVSLQR